MADQLKILKVDHRVCWVIFILLHLFVIAVMIGTFTTKSWVELDPVLPSFSYKGSLIYVEEGLADIPNLASPLHPFDLTHYTYEHVYCGACFVRDLLNQTTTPVATWNLYHAWCNMFVRLWFGAGLFIIFEVIALLCLAFSIVLLILFMMNTFYLRASLYAGGCLWASHYVAIFGWIGIAKVTFDDNCNDLYSGTSSPTLCAKDAPRLGVFLAVLLPVVMIPYLLIVCHIKRKKLVTESRLRQHQLEEVGNTNRADMNQPTDPRDNTIVAKDLTI